MNVRGFQIKTYFMAALVVPAILSIGAASGGGTFASPYFWLCAVLAFGWWFFYLWKTPMPEQAGQKYLPLFLAFAYYLVVWMICFELAGYESRHLPPLFYFLSLPMLGLVNLTPAHFPSRYTYMLMALYGLLMLTMGGVSVCRHKKTVWRRSAVLAVILFLCLGLCGIAVYQAEEAALQSLRIADEVNDWAYQPFAGSAKLTRLSEEPTLVISSDYPRLDGATAAWPVYASMTEFLYQGLDKETVADVVTCSTTEKAYERLMAGEVDIIFGAEPSRQQREMAKELGVELTLIPIAKEAFVFFVNEKNPVNDLTLSQIQDIYQGKIVNWTELGGENDDIVAFQRKENSGSQTVMLAHVMRDRPMLEPITEVIDDGMSWILEEVATYRNGYAAIGYSFRYFATGMRPQKGIKLLAVDGVFPSAENIRTGTYPFTVDVYAVTLGGESENTKALLEWILSAQGQRLIEACGYVGI